MKKTVLIAAAAVVLLGTAGATYAGNGWFDWGHRGHHDRGGPGFGGPDGMGGPEGMGGPDGMGGPMMRERMEKMFADFDADKDGKLTQEEIDKGQADRFAKANSDKTGGVSLAEFKPFFLEDHQEMVVRAFQRLDADGDGQVTEAEFADHTNDLVARLDRNGDNALSPEDRPAPGEGRGWRGHKGPRGNMAPQDAPAPEAPAPQQ